MRYMMITHLTLQDPITPSAVLAAPREELRGCGLSDRKTDYILSLATHFAEAHLTDVAIRAMPDEQLATWLTQAARGWCSTQLWK